MFQFDQNGYLIPQEIIEVSLVDLKKHFVDAFPPHSSRHKIFESYLVYIEVLQTHLTPNFVQWIDGSFITKKVNPGDIDVVSIIDHTLIEGNEDYILHTFTTFGVWERHGDLIDAFIVQDYPSNHPHYQDMVDALENYWMPQFGSDKDGIPRGFLKIIFDKNTLYQI